MTEGCVFCDHDMLREADLYFENDFCIYSSSRDPRDPPDVIPGCGAIVPKVHRASPFDLTAEEWAATRELLLRVRAGLHKRLAPDGYTLGWNDQGGLHAHLHLIPRFDDEPAGLDHRPCAHGSPEPGGVLPAQACLPALRPGDRQRGHGRRRRYVNAPARLGSAAGSSQPRSWLRSTALGGGPIVTGAL
jgi:histidine triad (HIT) family protein